MIFQGFEVCCPVCKSELQEQNEETWECGSCRRIFPVIAGIPDLRIFPDPYIDMESDRAKGLELAKHFDEFSFEELVEYYYSVTAVVPRHHARQYTRGIMAGEARAEAALKDWTSGLQLAAGGLLEIGCGTAPLLVAAAPRFKEVIGVDIAFRWLVVAKKRLSQAGLKVPLICACAEALPFPDASHAIAVFDSTLEVVADQKKSLGEVRRILKPGGHLMITTPNRHSLGPDPHLKIWAGGYLPESWIAAYARRQKAIPPKRKLLSARSLKRLLQESGFESASVSVPAIGEEQRKQLPAILRGMVSLYNISRKKAIAGSLFRSIGPLLQSIARKPVPGEKIDSAAQIGVKH